MRRMRIIRTGKIIERRRKVYFINHHTVIKQKGKKETKDQERRRKDPEKGVESSLSVRLSVNLSVNLSVYLKRVHTY